LSNTFKRARTEFIDFAKKMCREFSISESADDNGRTLIFTAITKKLKSIELREGPVERSDWFESGSSGKAQDQHLVLYEKVTRVLKEI